MEPKIKDPKSPQKHSSFLELSLAVAFLLFGGAYKLQNSERSVFDRLGASVMPEPPSILDLAPPTKAKPQSSTRLFAKAKRALNSGSVRTLETPSLEELDSVRTLEGLTTLPLSEGSMRLVKSLLEDEFSSGAPFVSLTQVGPLLEIVRKGVREAVRDTFRTPDFSGTFGYDMVRYEITHPDNTQSMILAYKEKTTSIQIAIGQEDTRPVFALFVVPEDSANSMGQARATLYKNGQAHLETLMSGADAWSSALGRIGKSVHLVSSR